MVATNSGVMHAGSSKAAESLASSYPVFSASSTISRTLKAALGRGFVEIQVTPGGWRDCEAERSLVR